MKNIHMNTWYKLFTAALLMFVFMANDVNAQKGHKIEVQVNGLSNAELYLGFHRGNQNFVTDTIQVNEKGYGAFKGEEPLKGGMYIIVTPDKKYFDLLIDKNQYFKVTTNLNELHKVKFEGSEQNTAFYKLNAFRNDIFKQVKEVQEKLKENPDDEALKAKLKEFDQMQLDEFDKIHKNYPGTLLSAFLKAMVPVQIPEFDIPDNIENKDSARWVRQYHYNKEHYWDNIDLSDPRLIRTPILDNKMDMFFSKVLLQIPDSLIPQINKVIRLSMKNKESFQYTTGTLINRYLKSEIMGMDAVWVDIAENYYLSGMATWADSTFLSELKENVMKSKFNLIGRVAKDLQMETYEGEDISLHSIMADYTILLFWEPNCGHCKKAVPALYDVYKKYKDYGVEVFAIYTQYDPEEWKTYMDEHKYDWKNVWDYSKKSYFRFYYNIKSTPTIYVLDANKKIIAKRIDVETVEKILQEELGL